MRRLLVFLAAGSLVLTGVTAAPALAAGGPSGDTPGVVSDLLTPEEEAAVHAEVEPVRQVDMYYNGQKVDPAAPWNGAAVCAEVSEDGTMQCFDSGIQANRYLAEHAPSVKSRAGAAQAVRQETAGGASGAEYTPQRASDCPAWWVCLWQHSNYGGRMLKWPWYPASKTRHLDSYRPSFRDEASSVYVNRPQRGVEAYDFRSFMPDPRMFFGAGYGMYPNLKNEDYPTGGNWNDKIDAIKF
ncbi:peptidase inhibitor family I36 protein [Streptomyces sp. NPDC002490]|uniref:peptidase inhibitor family I36 protein n=1 Tax=Streptomyces sp. NPDC002490 TaxID=3154416 RepID=UPI00331EDE1A